MASWVGYLGAAKLHRKRHAGPPMSQLFSLNLLRMTAYLKCSEAKQLFWSSACSTKMMTDWGHPLIIRENDHHLHWHDWLPGYWDYKSCSSPHLRSLFHILFSLYLIVILHIFSTQIYEPLRSLTHTKQPCPSVWHSSPVSASNRAVFYMSPCLLSIE